MVTTCTAFDQSRLTTFIMGWQSIAKDVGPTDSTLETMTCRPSASDVNMIIIPTNNVSIIYQFLLT